MWFRYNPQNRRQPKWEKKSSLLLWLWMRRAQHLDTCIGTTATLWTQSRVRTILSSLLMWRTELLFQKLRESEESHHKYEKPVVVDNVFVLGLKSKPNSVSVNGKPVSYNYDSNIEKLSFGGMSLSLVESKNTIVWKSFNLKTVNRFEFFQWIINLSCPWHFIPNQFHNPLGLTGRQLCFSSAPLLLGTDIENTFKKYWIYQRIEYKTYENYI